MDIYIIQEVRLENNLKSRKQIYKKFQADFVPRRGDFIDDLSFHEAHEVDYLVLNYESMVCHVYLKPVELPNKTEEAVNDYIRICQQNSWSMHGEA